MANDALGAAKRAKNDEFYTQYHDIEKEMNAYLDFNPDVFRGKTVLLPCDDPEWSNFTRYFAQNFERFGLKKLVSTSYAPDSNPQIVNYQPTLFETEDPKFDSAKTRTRGKIFTLYRETHLNEKLDFDDLQWDYLEGDGDFRSKEITILRDEADLIITNPPFSLFREFLAWLLKAKRNAGFVIIANMNALTYKEVFPLIRDNRMWLGATANGTDLVFRVPEGAVVAIGDKEKAARLGYVGDYTRMGNACWFTTVDHGRRHQPLSLMTKAENLTFSKHKELREKGYLEYDNYNAIDVSYLDAIPSDHEGAMGVPITFFSKYNPAQFELLDANDFRKPHQGEKAYGLVKDADGAVNGVRKYVRVLVRHRR